MDFDIRGDKKFIDVASDSTLQLRFKKLPPVQSDMVSKEDTQKRHLKGY